MDWFIDILSKYGPVGYIFGTGGTLAFIWFVWGQFREHDSSCQDFRREMRAVDQDIRGDISDLRTEMVGRTTKLDGKLDTQIAMLERMERNGNGSGAGCAARKKRKANRRGSSRTKAGGKR